MFLSSNDPVSEKNVHVITLCYGRGHGCVPHGNQKALYDVVLNVDATCLHYRTTNDLIFIRPVHKVLSTCMHMHYR